MTDGQSDSQASEATLFDVDEYRAADNAHRHAVDQNLPDDVTPADRILRGGLPAATSLRWQPLRCGLVNLYLFDNEVFPFADGRLLLRGDNGAGKSRVLALTLPLLLDGRLHPSRVEPDRDANRQIAWNLLMDEHQDRTGYTWIEFGRLDENGQPRFTTLGIGLRGVRGRGITDHWMFVTSQRIGEALSLITPEHRVASKRVLIDALGDSGQLYESSTEYRRAVDESLFRLGDRYEALLDLLLQLRQPQLAKKLDLAGLEAALVQAMPPVSSTLLSDAADAFRSLDQERETLNGLQQARLTVQEFLRPYRRHLRLGIRRAAGRLRTCHSRYELAGKSLRDAEQKKQIADEEATQLTEQLDACQRNQKSVSVALQTLQADPAMKQAERLNGARQLHDAATAALESSQAAADRIQQDFTDAQREAVSSQKEAERHIERAWQLSRDTSAQAAPEALQRLHHEQCRAFVAADAIDTDKLTPAARLNAGLTDQINRAERTLTDRLEYWRRTARHLAELSQHANDASDALKAAVRRLDDAQDHLQSVADEVIHAGDRVTATTNEVWQKLDKWFQLGAALTIGADDHETLRAEWLDWSTTLDGNSPATHQADVALRRVLNALATEQSELQQRQERLLARQEQLNEELRQLHGGAPVRPLSPTTRDDLARVDLPGEPLWQLLEFVPSVPHEDRAGWEAALEDAGLLDAWVYPDGKLRDNETFDTVLTVADDVIANVDSRLSRILAPAVDCRKFGVDPNVVGHLLDRIGCGPDSHHLWVDCSGRWQSGPLTGRWMKPIPQFIGHDIRSAWQERRIEELDQILAQLVEDYAATLAQQEELTQREQQVVAHRDQLPDDGPLRAAVAHKQELERQQQSAQHRVTEAAAHERDRREQRDETLRTRSTMALDTGLQDWAEQPRALLQRLESYASQLGGCLEAWRLAGTAADRCDRCRKIEQSKSELQQELHGQLKSAEQNEQARRAALEELQKTVGVDAQAITDRIAERESELSNLESEAHQLNDQLRQAEKKCCET